ncbi:hypothetical protein H9651_03365 [Microbacterium sp. Sa4CUA7]|uniref:NADH:ubiquinone oxidoreductase n=1 Tax=Microbacterium pullorum TaxID=2762236 RepID=A0ABR8RZL8_9MICO|nr:hypothetical protein [Microbacterium pullorum]MBD7956670.1 hypothetical protein [Microbacterium pullorum]
MRAYLLRSGLLTAITGGITLLRGLRNDEPFTWRTALAWLSWGITLALAIGAVVDTRRAKRGHLVAGDSPASGKQQQKLLTQRLKKSA